MSPRLFRSLLIAIALGAVVALGLAATASLSATLEALARFRWKLGPLVVLAVLANWTLRFAKWHFYLRYLRVPLPWRPSLRVFLAGFTMAISPGKLGEVLKAVLVRDLVGTPVSLTAAVVMAERLTDVAALLALGALGVTALPHGPLLLGGIGGALVVAVLALTTPAVGRQARRLLPARLVEPVRLFVHGGRALLTARALAIAFGLSVVSWFFECLAFSLILGGLDVVLPLRVTTFVYAFASLAGAVSMLPGGLGVAEGSLTGLLAGLGTPLPEAAAATLLVRGATLWLAVALGVVTLLVRFPRPAEPRPVGA
ncbi:MAG TPA: flippase-like domain-containing protein [Methylomirabilota bacterium]